MPKIPRDISGKDLAVYLKKYGYEITRQTGSHIRLTTSIKGDPHNITIPVHKPLKIGTLNNIIKDIAIYLMIDELDLIKELLE